MCGSVIFLRDTAASCIHIPGMMAELAGVLCRQRIASIVSLNRRY